RCLWHRCSPRRAALEASQVALDLVHDGRRRRRRADRVHLGRARAVPGDQRCHRLPRPFARHAPPSYPPFLRQPPLARTPVPLLRPAGRDGRAIRHDPSARHPRLGAAQAALPSLPGAPLRDPARRFLAAPLRAETRASARAGDGAAGAGRPPPPPPPAHPEGAAEPPGAPLLCAPRAAPGGLSPPPARCLPPPP